MNGRMSATPIMEAHARTIGKFECYNAITCMQSNLQMYENKKSLRLKCSHAIWLYVICLQDHNHHSVASQQGFFGGYGIFYVGTLIFLGF